VEGAIVTAHPHIEVFRRTYAAFTKGGMNALADVFAEDVVWHTRAEPALRRLRYEGRDATLASFEKEFELSGGRSCRPLCVINESREPV
jgi:ketosteroid isomerase-like protein